MNSSKLAFKRIMGDFLESLPPSKEYLILSFSPGSIPLKQKWSNNCLSADFLAEYFSSFFLEDNKCQINLEKQREIKSSISYLANELLENGMKYCVKESTLPIDIQINLTDELIILQLTNSISHQQTKHFQAQIEKLLQGNPSDMYLAQLEQNALAGDRALSNIGLLSMFNDYHAKIGWYFQPPLQPNEPFTVTTMVRLLI